MAKQNKKKSGKGTSNGHIKKMANPISEKKKVDKSKMKNKKVMGISKKAIKQLSGNKSRAAQLVVNPINVTADEFKDMTMEEVTEFKYMGTEKKTGKPFLQDYTKQGNKVKVSEKKILYKYNEVEAPIKQTIKGKDVRKKVQNEEVADESSKQTSKKNKTQKLKASYDKTASELEAIKLASEAKKNGLNDGSSNTGSATNKEAVHLAAAKKVKCVDVSAWDALHLPEPIKKALSEMGFSKPTKIQELALGPAINERLDILGAAETGSGKTLAFGIPIVANIYRDRQRRLEKEQQTQKIEQLREKTAQSKKKRDKAIMFSGDEIDSDDEDEEQTQEDDDDDGYVETDDNDVEEYLYNGPDGVMEVDYSALDNKKNFDSSDESDQESDMEETSGVESDKDDGSDEDDCDKPEAFETSDYLENENEEYDEDNIKSDESDGSTDLGSDDEQDMEASDDDEARGCVRVINNVEFPFDKKEKFVDNGTQTLVRALILTPTRELAIQVHKHLSPLCSHASIKACVLVGGLNVRKQKRLLRRDKPEIVVATPGRLWELIQDGAEHISDLRGVRYLAIDEADRMIDKKNFEEVHKIIRLLNSGSNISNNLASSHRQTLVFSATLTMVHKLPDRIAGNRKTVKDPTSEDKLHQLAKMIGMKSSAKILDVTRKHATAENLTECRINCELSEKDQYLYYFLQRHPGRTMVFCNSIEAVRRLRSIFLLLQCAPQDLHASMHQKQRLRNLQQFTGNENGLLITTDVAARGLDITGVRHVIHYQVPFTAESYVHRSGRTARGHHSGLSVVFIEPKDLLRFRQICNTLGRTNVNELSAFPVDEHLYDQVHDRVQMATTLEKLIHQNKRDEQFKAEKKFVSDNIGVLDSDEEIDQEDLKLMPIEFQRQRNSGGKKQEIKIMQVKLNELVSRPLLGAMFSFNHPTSRAALAAAMGVSGSNVPEELVGINPTKNMFADDGDQMTDCMDGASETSGACAVLKKLRKDMKKLTRKLLKPQETARETAKRMKEKNIELKQKKLAKKREQRHKKKMHRKN